MAALPSLGLREDAVRLHVEPGPARLFLQPGDMFNGYLQGLLQLQGILLNAWGLAAYQLKFSVSPSGLAPRGNAQQIWRAQLHIRHYAGFSLAPAYYDLPTVDGVHLTGPAYEI